MTLTFVNEGGLRICPCSIGSDWASCTPACFSSVMSMPTGWKVSGDVCAVLKFETPDASVPLKLHWLFTPPCWFKITDDWPLSWGFAGMLRWLSCSSDGLWFAEVTDWLGFRNLAHSWPVTISSNKLNEPRPNSKSLPDLPQEKRFCKLSAVHKCGQELTFTMYATYDSLFVLTLDSDEDTFSYSKQITWKDQNKQWSHPTTK